MAYWSAMVAIGGTIMVNAAIAAPPSDVVVGAWQHHKETFDYAGFTSAYTCEGLENHVRQILLTVGARKDVNVSAGGWAALIITPKKPDFMGDGDCELIQGMKDLITRNFSLRDIEYRTDCSPHQITMNGFSIKGQALRALPLQAVRQPES